VKPVASRAKRFWLAYSALIALAAVFVVPLCGWIYQCGCTFLWAGAERYCNIHHAEGPHCPWCVAGGDPLPATALGFLLFAPPAVAIHWFNKRPGVSTPKLFVAGLLTFLLAAIISGYIFKVIYDYPHFLIK
jgi:hypothetical protein